MSDSSEIRLTRAVDYVTSGRPLPGVGKIAKLVLPAESAEFRRCSEIQAILEDYSSRPADAGPLSIAVFGPPGSGKSFCVEELVASLKNKGKWDALQIANLSQMPDLKGLATFLRQVFGVKRRNKGRDSAKTRVLFFDEFDSPLAGEPLGWLRWFLAPMQDGKFFSENDVIQLQKSILVFAGGTAPSLEEFERRASMDPQEYRAKKVPDFISRLRGFIDIQGVNGMDEERPVRRALVLGHLLSKRWPDSRNGSGGFPIADGLARKLLATAHFVHGVRSMSALLDTSRLKSGESLEEGNLPGCDLRRLHISRGPLDGKVIGISAGLRDEDSRDLLKELTRVLLGSGATLAYGGDFIPKGTLDDLVTAARSVPDDLIERSDLRIRNYLGFPSFRNPDVQTQHRMADGVVDFRCLDTLSRFEQEELGLQNGVWFPARPLNGGEYQPRHHLAWAISLYRMRVRMCQDIHALIVLGGKDGGSWGRFAGIAEEVMLAIAMGKPVYLLGGRGGSSRSVGQLLGLGETIVNPDGCLDDPGPIGPTAFRADTCFALPGYPSLPQTVAELRTWFQQRPVWTDAWPWNGLDIEENRKLFLTPIPSPEQMTCVQLVLDGLCRLDWKPKRG